MPYCPECGTEVEATDAFCPNCGHSLAEIGEPSGGPEGEGPAGRTPESTGETPEEPGPEPAASSAGSGEPTSGPSEPARGHAEAADTPPSDADTGGEDRRVDIPDDPFEMDVFEFAFKYPLVRGWRQVGIGAIVVFLSFLVLPLIILGGYNYRLGRSAALGLPTTPEWGDWWGLLVDGFRLLVTLLVVGVVAGIGFAAFLVAGLEALAFLWYLVVLVASVGVLATFLGTGSVKATFGDFRCLRFVGTTEFWLGLAYSIGANFVLQIAFFIGALLLIITIIGIIPLLLLLPVFQAYSYFVQTSIWGRMYYEAEAAGKVDSRIVSEEVPSRW